MAQIYSYGITQCSFLRSCTCSPVNYLSLPPAALTQGLHTHACREVGGIENIVSVLKALAKASVSTPLGRDLRTTLLAVLLALAVDEDNRVAAYKAGLVPLLVYMLSLKDDPVRLTLKPIDAPCHHHRLDHFKLPLA